VVCYTVVDYETVEYIEGGKLDFNDFSTYTPEMLEYCKQDVRLNLAVYKRLLAEGKDFSTKSISLEQQQQGILCRQMRSGFKLDKTKAEKLLDTCKARASAIEAEILQDFPPLPKQTREYHPRLNKDGATHAKNTLGPLADSYGFGYDGDPYSGLTWVEFNLQSPTQIVKRMEGHWEPTDMTPKGNPKVSEKNLATVKDTAPQSVKNLALYRMYTSRISMIEQWLEALGDDERVRGRVIHIGSWSGRMAHQSPNTANIPGIRHGTEGILLGQEGAFGYECRSLWTVAEGYKLVGTDASGIQLRVLAHYLNNREYTQAVLEDIHTFNATILGCDRPTAKTFIYSWLLGAGVAKTAEILNCSTAEAVVKRERFVKLTPGLEEFMHEKSRAVDRGYYRGLDGRIVYIPNEHLALTAYLQNGEGAVMRMANVLWDRWARQRGIKFKQCAMVHDEWQCEVEAGRAEEFGQLQEHSFVKAGELLNMNLPLAGEHKIGMNWAETH